jgi:hypothetical protein
MNQSQIDTLWDWRCSYRRNKLDDKDPVGSCSFELRELRRIAAEFPEESISDFVRVLEMRAHDYLKKETERLLREEEAYRTQETINDLKQHQDD